MALNAKQLTLLEYMLSNPNTPVTKCVEDCGIPRRTYYNWKEKGEFQAELDKRIREKWKDSERLATETMINLCAKGDYAAAKYILDNLGYKPVDKVQADIHTDINITIEE